MGVVLFNRLHVFKRDEAVKLDGLFYGRYPAVGAGWSTHASGLLGGEEGIRQQMELHRLECDHLVRHPYIHRRNILTAGSYQIL